MELKKQQVGNKLIVSVSGRLDTNAAQIMMKELEELHVDQVKEIELDKGACDIEASSGHRANLWAQKKMNGLGGSMVVKNVIGDVMEVFEMTGFADILTFA